MSQKLQLLTTELKRARSLSYYGKYPEAIEQFDKVQSGIVGQIFHIADKTLSLQWNKFLEEIKYEKNLVQATVEMLSGKVDVKIPNKQMRQVRVDLPNEQSTSSGSYKKISQGYSKEQQLQRKPKMPFGKDPFKKRVHEDDQVYNRKQKQRRKEQEDEERRLQKQNQRNNQKPSTPGNEDEDVWNQIFPKQKPTQKPIAKKPSNTYQPPPNKVTQNQSIMGKKDREYEKTWLKNAATNKNNNKNDKNNKQGAKEERKTFAKHCYPNGDGPDTHLIETLEREVVDFNPNITFDDIAELTKAKDILEEAVLLPLNFPQLFTGNRRAWKGVMLFGPPGTGKTLLAKAVASSGATTFFNVTASSLASKWRGQSQKMVRLLFEMAKFYAPTTIFIDEIDCIASARGEKEDEASRKVKTELMTRLDGCTTGEDGKLITLIAATNRPWDLDDAILRRLQKRVYIPLPSEIGRRQLLKINLKNEKLQNVDQEDVVRRTEGYSGADIANLCRQAAYMPMRRKLKSEGGLGNKLKDPAWKEQFKNQVNIPLTMDDFNEALKNVKPSVGPKGLQQFIEWGEQFGEKGTN